MSKLPKSDLDCYWSNTAAQNLRARKSSARYKISPQYLAKLFLRSRLFSPRQLRRGKRYSRFFFANRGKYLINFPTVRPLREEGATATGKVPFIGIFWPL